MCERAKFFDSGGDGEPRSTLFGRPSWPSAKDERVGPLKIINVSKLYHPARSLDPLRFAAWVAPRCARVGLPGGGLLPGQDLLDLLVLLVFAHLFPHAGFIPAHPSLR